MLHKHIRKHVSRLHAHIQEHGHKRALVMIMSSMVMMFYPYFSTRADLLPSGGDITVQYSPDDLVEVNTDVVATVVYNSASGVTFAESDTYTFTENGQYVFEYYEDGITGTITAEVDWIDKEAPTGTVAYNGDLVTGPVVATLTTSEDVIVTSVGGPVHTFTDTGTFLFTFEDPAGNTGSALAEVTSIGQVQNPRDEIDILYTIDTANNVLELDWTPIAGYEYISINLNTSDPANNFGGLFNMASGGTDLFLWGDENIELYTVNFALADEDANLVAGTNYFIEVNTEVEAFDNGFDNVSHTRNGGNIEITRNNTIQEDRTIMVFVFDQAIGDYQVLWQPGVASQSGEIFSHPVATGGVYQIKLLSIKQIDTEYYEGGQQAGQAVLYTINESNTGTTPPTPTLTGITATVSYVSGTTVTATATGFNMPGVFAVNNSNSLTYTFTSPGSFTFALQTAGGNTGSVTATATAGMFTTGSTNTGTNNSGTTTPPPVVNTGVCDAGDLVLTGALGGVYSLTTPVVVGGLFSINWAAANNHCNPDQIVTVQLRDHNGQWLTLGTGELDGTGVVFRSTGLAYTGLYSIFGTHASGTVYSYTGTSGQQLTGIYTVNTPYTIYTGSYTGAYTGLWTGYQVRILNASGTDLLSGARPFTIDNATPSLTGLALLINGANGSGVVGSGGTFTLSFVGSELLSNIQLLVNNTLVKSWTGGSSTGYTLTGGFGATNMAGPIAYTVNFTDAAGNTGSVTGTNIYTIDTIDPNFQAFAVTGTAASGVKFSWNTSKSSVYNFQFSLSGSTGTVVPLTTTIYATSHNYTTTALATGKTYLFSIKINDSLQNTNFMSGTVAVNASGAASVTIATQSNNILQLSAQVEAGLFAKMLRKEIENFEECKAELDINEVEIDLGSNKKISFNIPDVSKKTTKTILSTFASVLTAKLKSANLTATQLKEIENKSNNFFAVTALLQEGSCKQNLSAYHINLFENAMKQMKLQLFK